MITDNLFDIVTTDISSLNVSIYSIQIRKYLHESVLWIILSWNCKLLTVLTALAYHKKLHSPTLTETLFWLGKAIDASYLI